MTVAENEAPLKELPAMIRSVPTPGADGDDVSRGVAGIEFDAIEVLDWASLEALEGRSSGCNSKH